MAHTGSGRAESGPQIPRLLLISDEARTPPGRPLHELAARALGGGVDAVLVREPQLETCELCARLDALEPLRARGLRVLVSRRLDVARSCALDGVQLAADAIPVAEARSWLGPRAWIGYSAHSGEEARAAERDGADYVTLSPIYATASKPGLPGRGPQWLARELRGLRIPALALGGVTPGRTAELLRCGAWGAAVVSALTAASDVSRAALEFSRTIMESAA